MQKIVVYTKKGCPLCDEAIEILKALQKEFHFEIKEMDIYKDDKLLEQYQLMIPVIEMEKEVIAYGKIEENFLRKRFPKETIID